MQATGREVADCVGRRCADHADHRADHHASHRSSHLGDHAQGTCADTGAERGLLAAGLVLILVGGLVGLSAPAEARKATSAVPTVRHELPFVCGGWWTGSTRKHHSPSKHAIDFNAPKDDGKAVIASARGVVTKADNTSTRGYGRHVIVDHGNGESTVYAHLKRVFVTVGATVDQGGLLGDLGNTGNSSGAHLHYEQRLQAKVVAPWFSGLPYVHSLTQSANCADVPVAGDVFEGGADEVAVFRRQTAGQVHVLRNDAQTLSLAVGRGVDEPVLGDWDGDGLTETGAWSPRTKKFTLAGEATFTTVKYGNRGDRPVAGDWDGDGVFEIGVRRASRFVMRSAEGKTTPVPLGDADDLPVTGDWDGDGRTDLGVYDPATSTFTLRTLVKGRAVLTNIAHGTPGDLPVVGDWNGDGITDLGVWTPATATFTQRDLQGMTLDRSATVRFGAPR